MGLWMVQRCRAQCRSWRPGRDPLDLRLGQRQGRRREISPIPEPSAPPFLGEFLSGALGAPTAGPPWPTPHMKQR